MNENQIPQVMEIVRSRLNALGRSRRAELKLEEHDYHLDDEWLYLVVMPSKPGVRASDYSEILSDIEKELRAKDFENVLLVPAVSD